MKLRAVVGRCAGGISTARARSVAVAEFPTTVAAARAVRDLGPRVIARAPNVLRGGSRSGNVSATELVDGLTGDYPPPAATVLLAGRGLIDLPDELADALRAAHSGADADDPVGR
ncbi:hypothetical protein [Actinoallomurus iriomotensis]|uniref:Uncharacterized protein n=1 Tax=Actinoallomurus iriomotensis TaxID=478107 RepID=A0A9W6RYZ1_9ACTN|nr:hypothetical protein [Actinoallomurus iriomotensis]GLY85361.1 hypothetical protein Airi02_032900 [Actinoallomurus iriomotensis]